MKFKNKKKENQKWCDLTCEYADFAKVDALDGACNTWQSIWCKKLNKHVLKNSLCSVKRE
jgi:hypothetical protein